MAAINSAEPQVPQGADLDAGVEEERRYNRRRRKVFRILLVIVPVLLAAAVLVWWYYSGRESTDDARVNGHVSPVSARVGGHVIYAPFEENASVTAGTVLVRIDPRDYEVELRRAEAELAAAQAAVNAAQINVPIASTNTEAQLASARAAESEASAGVEVALREVDTARAGLRQAEAAVSQAKANAERAALDLARYKQLVDRNEIPRQQYDATVAEAESTKAAVQTAEAGVIRATEGIRAAESRLAQSKARVTQAESAVEAAKSGPQQVKVTQAQAGTAEATLALRAAAVEQARLNLQYTTVSAPADGIIGRRAVEVGQNIQPGQPLYSLVALNRIWITANFKETQLAKMHPGQRARVSVDAYGGREYEGKVDSIGAATGATFSMLPAENATGNYVKVVQRVPVKIVLEQGQDKEHLLRPGMSVVPTVFTR